MNKIKRRYNAAYRLRKKLGRVVFPKRSRIIHTQADDAIMNQSEVKILLQEFGYIIKPQLFQD